MAYSLCCTSHSTASLSVPAVLHCVGIALLPCRNKDFSRLISSDYLADPGHCPVGPSPTRRLLGSEDDFQPKLFLEAAGLCTGVSIAGQRCTHVFFGIASCRAYGYWGLMWQQLCRRRILTYWACAVAGFFAHLPSARPLPESAALYCVSPAHLNALKMELQCQP